MLGINGTIFGYLYYFYSEFLTYNKNQVAN